MSTDLVLDVAPLGFPWQTQDPFLFCAYHDDDYPAGTESMEPAVSLAGRDLGQDFVRKDGFRMYHGRTVPGFPQHPHRGFETVTVVRRGLIDHSDSLGAAARFGNGDVQWLTAGEGIVHAEMFPLLRQDGPNPLELFQIWLNLPAADKMAPPHFSMLWNASVPRRQDRDSQGRMTEVTVVTGALGDTRALAAPPRSWAARAEADVAIWTLKLAPKAQWTLPAAGVGTNRTLYFFKGASLRVAGQPIDPMNAIAVADARDIPLEAGPDGCELLLLQGRPIGEPVAQYGPFVMNTQAEIQQAFSDYRRTQFGGWPWPKDDPVSPRAQARFARHIDGRIETP